MPNRTFPKIQCFLNLKGGVGKSTLASQFAYKASAIGYKTLAIDLDPQAHLTNLMYLPLTSEEIARLKTFRDVVVDRADPSDVIQEVMKNLYLLPSNLSLSSIDMALAPKTNREKRIINPLLSLRDHFDLIVIDTNPSASLLNLATIQAADRLCVVTQTAQLSLLGLRSLFEILQELDLDAGVSTPPALIIPNLFVAKGKESRAALGLLKEEFGDILLSEIHRCVDYQHADKKKQSVFEYSLRSQASKDMDKLTESLLS